MIITDKMIRELQRRVDVSYEEAERYLRRAGGNIDMAEAYARKKQNSFFHRLFQSIENLINTTFVYRLKVYRDDDVMMDMPIFLFFILLLIVGVDRTITIGVIFVVIALIAECQLKLHKVEVKETFRFYRTVKKGAEKQAKTEEDIQSEPNNTAKAQEVIEDNGYSNNAYSNNVEEKANDDTINNTLDDNEEYYEVTIDK